MTRNSSELINYELKIGNKIAARFYETPASKLAGVRLATGLPAGGLKSQSPQPRMNGISAALRQTRSISEFTIDEIAKESG